MCLARPDPAHRRDALTPRSVSAIPVVEHDTHTHTHTDCKPSTHAHDWVIMQARFHSGGHRETASQLFVCVCVCARVRTSSALSVAVLSAAAAVCAPPSLTTAAAPALPDTSPAPCDAIASSMSSVKPSVTHTHTHKQIYTHTDKKPCERRRTSYTCALLSAQECVATAANHITVCVLVCVCVCVCVSLTCGLCASLHRHCNGQCQLLILTQSLTTTPLCACTTVCVCGSTAGA